MQFKSDNVVLFSVKKVSNYQSFFFSNSSFNDITIKSFINAEKKKIYFGRKIYSYFSYKFVSSNIYFLYWKKRFKFIFVFKSLYSSVEFQLLKKIFKKQFLLRKFFLKNLKHIKHTYALLIFNKLNFFFDSVFKRQFYNFSFITQKSLKKLLVFSNNGINNNFFNSKKLFFQFLVYRFLSFRFKSFFKFSNDLFPLNFNLFKTEKSINQKNFNEFKSLLFLSNGSKVLEDKKSNKSLLKYKCFLNLLNLNLERRMPSLLKFNDSLDFLISDAKKSLYKKNVKSICFFFSLKKHSFDILYNNNNNYLFNEFNDYNFFAYKFLKFCNFFLLKSKRNDIQQIIDGSVSLYNTFNDNDVNFYKKNLKFLRSYFLFRKKKYFLTKKNTKKFNLILSLFSVKKVRKKNFNKKKVNQKNKKNIRYKFLHSQNLFYLGNVHLYVHKMNPKITVVKKHRTFIFFVVNYFVFSFDLYKFDSVDFFNSLIIKNLVVKKKLLLNEFKFKTKKYQIKPLFLCDSSTNVCNFIKFVGNDLLNFKSMNCFNFFKYKFLSFNKSLQELKDKFKFLSKNLFLFIRSHKMNSYFKFINKKIKKTLNILYNLKYIYFKKELHYVNYNYKNSLKTNNNNNEKLFFPVLKEKNNFNFLYLVLNKFIFFKFTQNLVSLNTLQNFDNLLQSNGRLNFEKKFNYLINKKFSKFIMSNFLKLNVNAWFMTSFVKNLNHLICVFYLSFKNSNLSKINFSTPNIFNKFYFYIVFFKILFLSLNYALINKFLTKNLLTFNSFFSKINLKKNEISLSSFVKKLNECKSKKSSVFNYLVYSNSLINTYWFLNKGLIFSLYNFLFKFLNFYFQKNLNFIVKLNFNKSYDFISSKFFSVFLSSNKIFSTNKLGLSKSIMPQIKINPFIILNRNFLRRINMIFLSLKITKRNFFINLIEGWGMKNIFSMTGGETKYEGRLKKTKEAGFVVGRRLWNKLLKVYLKKSKVLIYFSRFFSKNIFSFFYNFRKYLKNKFLFKNTSFSSLFLYFKLLRFVKKKKKIRFSLVNYIIFLNQVLLKYNLKSFSNKICDNYSIFDIKILKLNIYRKILYIKKKILNYKKLKKRKIGRKIIKRKFKLYFKKLFNFFFTTYNINIGKNLLLKKNVYKNYYYFKKPFLKNLSKFYLNNNIKNKFSLIKKNIALNLKKRGSLKRKKKLSRFKKIMLKLLFSRKNFNFGYFYLIVPRKGRRIVRGILKGLYDMEYKFFIRFKLKPKILLLRKFNFTFKTKRVPKRK